MLTKFRLFSSRRTFGSHSLNTSQPTLWNQIGLKMRGVIDWTFGLQPQQYIQHPQYTQPQHTQPQHIQPQSIGPSDLMSNYDTVEDLVADYEEMHDIVDPEAIEEFTNYEGMDMEELMSTFNAVRPQNVTRRFEIHKPTSTLSSLGINFPESDEQIVRFCCTVPVHKDSKTDKIDYLHPNVAAISVVNSAAESIDVGVAWITDKDFHDAFTRQLENGIRLRLVHTHATVPQMKSIMDYYDKIRAVYPDATVELKFACGAPTNGKGQSFFHNKFVSIDGGKCCFIGSNNWSEGSWNYHWESGVLFVNHPICNAVNDFFNYVWDFGIPPVEPYPASMKSRIANHVPKKRRRKN